jgi:hypothetical protein
MPIFPLSVTPDGATISIGVSAPSVYVSRETRPRTWTALIDTGATMSIISPSVVSVLRPPRLGFAPVGRSGGVRTFEPTFEVRFRLGGHRQTPSRWFALEAIEIRPATPNVDILIGTDLLIRLELMWQGPTRHGFLAYLFPAGWHSLPGEFGTFGHDRPITLVLRGNRTIGGSGLCQSGGMEP